MKTKKNILPLILVALITAYIVFIVRGGTEDKEKINWVTLEEAQSLAAKEPRKILVDIYTDWCGFCKKMDKETFRNHEIIDYINKNYYAVKLNAESKDVINYQGKKMSYEDIAFDVFGVKVYPTLVFIDSKFTNPVSSEGYHSKPRLEELLKNFNEKSANAGMK